MDGTRPVLYTAVRYTERQCIESLIHLRLLALSICIGQVMDSKWAGTIESGNNSGGATGFTSTLPTVLNGVPPWSFLTFGNLYTNLTVEVQISIPISYYF